MSNEVVPVNLDNLPVSPYADTRSFEAVSSTGNFLPRIQIMGGNSDLVQEGKINVGRLCLIKSKNAFADLGSETHLFVLSWRPKALKIDKGTKDVTSVFDPKNPEFIAIQEASDTPDSGCMFGPEFLVYVQSENSFATFHMSSKTARREAPNMLALLKKWCSLSSQVIKARGYTWQGPVVKICNSVYDLPPSEEILAAVERFVNPPVSEVEAAPADSGRER